MKISKQITLQLALYTILLVLLISYALGNILPSSLSKYQTRTNIVTSTNPNDLDVELSGHKALIWNSTDNVSLQFTRINDSWRIDFDFPDDQVMIAPSITNLNRTLLTSSEFSYNPTTKSGYVIIDIDPSEFLQVGSSTTILYIANSTMKITISPENETCDYLFCDSKIIFTNLDDTNVSFNSSHIWMNLSNATYERLTFESLTKNVTDYSCFEWDGESCLNFSQNGSHLDWETSSHDIGSEIILQPNESKTFTYSCVLPTILSNYKYGLSFQYYGVNYSLDPSFNTTNSSFPEGTFNRTYLNESGFVELNLSQLYNNGTYISEIFNASAESNWDLFTWFQEVCYQCDLPDNELIETGNYSSIADMTNNTVLFHLDEEVGDSGTVYDSSGYSNNGTTTFTGSGTCSGVSGVFNNSCYFDGSGDYIDVFNDNLDGFVNVTIELWFNTTDFESNEMIGNRFNPTEAMGDWNIRFNPSKTLNLFFFHGNGVANAQVLGVTSANYNFKSGEWNHLVITFEIGGNIIIYGNSKLLTSKPTNVSHTDIFNNNNAFYIGSYGDNGAIINFNGSIDEVAIYTRILSINEVENHFKRGIARLNLSLRSCDDASCSGETWIQINDTSPVNLTDNGIINNTYFQYNYSFETEHENYSSRLYNVTIDYILGDLAPTVNILNTSFSTTDLTPSIFFNVTDDLNSTLDCILYMNNTAYDQNTSVDNNTNTELTVNVTTLQFGTYTARINCSDGLNTGADSINVTIESSYTSIRHFDLDVPSVVIDSDTYVLIDNVSFSAVRPNQAFGRGSAEIVKASGGATSEVFIKIVANGDTLIDVSLTSTGKDGVNFETKSTKINHFNFTLAVGTNYVEAWIREEGLGSVNISNCGVHMTLNETAKNNTIFHRINQQCHTYENIPYAKITDIPVNKSLNSSTFFDLSHRINATDYTIASCFINNSNHSPAYFRSLADVSDVGRGGFAYWNDLNESGDLNYSFNCKTDGPPTTCNITTLIVDMADSGNYLVNAFQASNPETDIVSNLTYSAGTHVIANYTNFTIKSGNEIEVISSASIRSLSGNQQPSTFISLINSSNNESSNSTNMDRYLKDNTDYAVLHQYNSYSDIPYNETYNIYLYLVVPAGETVELIDESLTGNEMFATDTTTGALAPIVTLLVPDNPSNVSGNEQDINFSVSDANNDVLNCNITLNNTDRTLNQTLFINITDNQKINWTEYDFQSYILDINCIDESGLRGSDSANITNQGGNITSVSISAIPTNPTINTEFNISLNYTCNSFICYNTTVRIITSSPDCNATGSSIYSYQSGDLDPSQSINETLTYRCDVVQTLNITALLNTSTGNSIANNITISVLPGTGMTPTESNQLSSIATTRKRTVSVGSIYSPGDNVTISISLEDINGTPISNEIINATIYYPDQTQMVNVTLVELTNGIYTNVTNLSASTPFGDYIVTMSSPSFIATHVFRVEPLEQYLSDINSTTLKNFRYSLSNFHEIDEDNSYLMKLRIFDDDFNPLNATSIPTITLFYPNRSVVLSEYAMTFNRTGVYTFNYTAENGFPSGAWETEVNLTVLGISITDSDYWELEVSPAGVNIVAILDNTIPSITARFNITNDGTTGYDYPYEWCITNESNTTCDSGSVNVVDYGSATVYLLPGQTLTTDRTLHVLDPGVYYFKVVVYYGTERRGASQQFNAIEYRGPGPTGGVLPTTTTTVPTFFPEEMAIPIIKKNVLPFFIFFLVCCIIYKKKKRRKKKAKNDDKT